MRVFMDDPPGEQVFRYSLGANSFWQVYGTMTGPASTYVPYAWSEKWIAV